MGGRGAALPAARWAYPGTAIGIRAGRQNARTALSPTRARESSAVSEQTWHPVQHWFTRPPSMLYSPLDNYQAFSQAASVL